MAYRGAMVRGAGGVTWAVAMVIGSVFAHAGCQTPETKPPEHPVVRMAPFDLECPKEKLSYHQLDENTWGVIGCERRTKYVRICRQVGQGFFTSDECQWVKN